MQAHQDQKLTAFEPDHAVDSEDYAAYIGRGRLDEIKRLADGVRGKSWANINSTFSGGGVAEMLRSVVPFAHSLGVDAVEGEMTDLDVSWLRHKLEMYGLEAPNGVENMTKIVSGKQLWNYDNLEPTEKKLVL